LLILYNFSARHLLEPEILNLRFPAADYVDEISGMAVTNMDCPWRERAAQRADLGIFV